MGPPQTTEEYLVHPFISTLIAIAAVVLSGCASTTGNNFAGSLALDAATIRAKWLRESAAVWEGFRIQSVDNKFFSPGWTVDTSSVKVDAGPRSFVVSVEFNRGFGVGGPFSAFVPLRAELKPNATYQLDGEFESNLVKVWLEDTSTRQRVSEPASAPWQKRAPSVTVPIFIPAR